VMAPVCCSATKHKQTKAGSLGPAVGHLQHGLHNACMDFASD
jgi:hypothetical protein